MDGDVERLSFRHVEHPQVRGMELRGSRQRTYNEEDFQGAVEAFEKLRANQPDMILEAAVRVMHPCGRLAVGMTVKGTHAELHVHANEWVKLLGAGESRVGYEWSIDH